MPDVKCPECGSEIGFFESQFGGDSQFYCTDTQCKLHGGIGRPKTPSALDVQIGGDWYKTLVIQPIEYCQKNNLNMAESGVVKYVTRHKAKNGKQDLLKARHLIDMLIELEYPE